MVWFVEDKREEDRTNEKTARKFARNISNGYPKLDAVMASGKPTAPLRLGWIFVRSHQDKKVIVSLPIS